MYNITTTWQIIFNDKSVFFRTEGSKSSVSRSNGLQPYGIKELDGSVVSTSHPFIEKATGVFEARYQTTSAIAITSDANYYQLFYFNTNKQIKSYSNDVVVDNYQIRIYKLLTINGKKVSDIIGA